MRNTWKIAVGLYLVAQVLFLVNIQFPQKVDFDEFHYVPAAKSFFHFETIPNQEHPPLAKMIIAAGISALGDNPAGWRIMSTIFGAITLVGMFFWGLALFRDEKIAAWLALLTLFNQLLYVQARIAMLDTFMFAFMTWGFAAFTASWWTDLEEHRIRRLLLATGVLFGLATACKWYGLMGWLTCAAMVVLVALFRKWGVSFAASERDAGRPRKARAAEQAAAPLKTMDWYSPELWKGITFQDWVMYLGMIPAAVYFITFLPYLFFQNPHLTLWGLVPFQWKMYSDQLRVVGTHPYMSQWTQWPLMNRPIWYAFDTSGADYKRCVLLLGNPLVMWGGLLALVACAWGVIQQRSREGFLILVFYLGLLGSWILIPRRISFYYYYYPAGMVLSLACAYVFQFVFGKVRWARWAFLGVAFGLFVYFFPVLSGIRIPSGNFRDYMWFNSWI